MDNTLDCRESNERIVIINFIISLVFIAVGILIGVALQRWYKEAKAAD